MEDWQFADIPEFIPRGDGGKRRRDRRKRNRVIVLCSSVVVVLTAITVFSFGMRNSRATPVPPTTQTKTIEQTTRKTPETTSRQPETSAAQTTIAETSATEMLVTTLEPTITIKDTTTTKSTTTAATTRRTTARSTTAAARGVRVTGVRIESNTLRIKAHKSGEEFANTGSFRVIVEPSSAADKGFKLSFSNLNAQFISKNQRTGVVRMRGSSTPGETIVTVTTDDGGYKTTCVVKVY